MPKITENHIDELAELYVNFRFDPNPDEPIWEGGLEGLIKNLDWQKAELFKLVLESKISTYPERISNMVETGSPYTYKSLSKRFKKMSYEKFEEWIDSHDGHLGADGIHDYGNFFQTRFKIDGDNDVFNLIELFRGKSGSEELFKEWDKFYQGIIVWVRPKHLFYYADDRPLIIEYAPRIGGRTDLYVEQYEPFKIENLESIIDGMKKELEASNV